MNFLLDIFEVKANDFYTKKERRILVVLFVLLWIYLFLRGIHLPLMHDEIATFYFYVQSGVVFPPEAHYDANNHVINSLFSHWSYQLFGSSPLAIRLPNVLAFALYFWSIQKISSRLRSTIYRWGFLLAVTMSYFIFEYFSETRGYGLALAFLFAAIYQYIRLTENAKTIHLILAAVFLWLSTCANLTSLVSSIILFTLMFLHTWISDFKSHKKRFLYKLLALILLGLPFLILVQWSFKLKELGLLYYGSLDGFYEVTLQSLFEVYVGSYHWWMGILVTIIFAVLLIYLADVWLKERKLKQLISGPNVLPVLMIGSVVMIQLLAKVMEVNYPEDRAGIYLFPYLAGAFAVSMNHYSKNKKWLNTAAVVYLFFPISFLWSISLRQASFWIDARTSEPIFEKVSALESDFKFPLLVGGYATQELCWYYLNHQSSGTHGRLHWTNHPGIDADVELISPTRMENPLVRAYYDSMYYDQAADLIYWKRKNRLEKKLILKRSVEDITNSKTDYYTLFTIPADSFINKTLYIGTESTLDAESAPFRSRLVAAVDGKEPNMVYEFIQLDWLRKSWKGEENNLLQGTMIHNIPEGAQSISFYLWNPDTTTFSLTNGQCYLYEIIRDY